jgi:hypothetical protein
VTAEVRSSRRELAVAGGLTLATCAAVYAAGGNLSVAVAPVALAAAAWLVCTLPPRTPALGLLALVLLVDDPAARPAEGRWESPLAPLGHLLYDNLRNLTGVDALRFSVLDVLVLVLLADVLRRKLTGARPQAGASPARCTTTAAIVSVAAVVGLEVWGIATGGDFRNSLWQIRQLLFAPLLVLLLQGALRGPRDHRALAGILVGAACAKALLGLWYREVVCRPLFYRPAYVTTHSDSMLFVVAAFSLVALWSEGASRRTRLLALGALPIIFGGMVINDRRLAWVELAIVLALTASTVPWSPVKRRAARAAIIALPFVTIYALAGWSSTSRVFRPVAIARSVVSADSDRSTGTRDIENYNLTRTFRQRPLVPWGFGHPYLEEVKADDISAAFPQYRHVPHNSVLGLWAFAGVVGFGLVWLPHVVGLYLAFRAYPRARAPGDRAAALTVVAAAVTYAIQGWGDMGLQSWECTFLLAAGLAVASRLSTAVGAWPASAGVVGGEPAATARAA